MAHVAEGDAEDINRAVSAARKAFDEGPWPRMTAYVCPSFFPSSMLDFFVIYLWNSRKDAGYSCALLIWLKSIAMSLQLWRLGTVGSPLNRLSNPNCHCLCVYFTIMLVR